MFGIYNHTTELPIRYDWSSKEEKENFNFTKSDTCYPKDSKSIAYKNKNIIS